MGLTINKMIVFFTPLLGVTPSLNTIYDGLEIKSAVCLPSRLKIFQQEHVVSNATLSTRQFSASCPDKITFGLTPLL